MDPLLEAEIKLHDGYPRKENNVDKIRPHPPARTAGPENTPESGLQGAATTLSPPTDTVIVNTLKY